EELKEKSISEVEILTVVEEEGDTWMTPIYKNTSRRNSTIGYEESKGNKTQVMAAYDPSWPRLCGPVTIGPPCTETQEPIPGNPQQKLNPITSPWPFYKWGIDIAGPFPEGPWKVKFLIVAMDYFTKWIEAKLVAIITGNQIKKFVWDNIVCRFGLPGEIISNNGK
ncbi:reverse transcriptase domain-containing protein, partial [Tanacetum coccineum]